MARGVEGTLRHEQPTERNVHFTIGGGYHTKQTLYHTEGQPLITLSIESTHNQCYNPCTRLYTQFPSFSNPRMEVSWT
jgi:hypothetical protein